METDRMNQIVMASVCGALCVVLTQIGYLIPQAGGIYSAVYMPIFLCAVCSGAGGGLLCALVGVLLPAVLLGLPSLLLLPPALAECISYAVIGALFFRKSVYAREKKCLLWGMTVCMLVGRSAGGLTAALLYSPGIRTISLWIAGYLCTGLPGLLIGLILMPRILCGLRDMGFCPFSETAAIFQEKKQEEMGENPEGCEVKCFSEEG